MNTIKTFLTVLAVAAGITLSAQAGPPGWDNGTFTNGITIFSNSVVTGPTAQSQAIPVVSGYDLAVFPKSGCAGNTNTIFGFNVYSGTSWSTTQPLTATNTGNFGTNVVGYVVFTKAQLAGAQQIRWDYLSTTDFTWVTNNGCDYSWFH